MARWALASFEQVQVLDLTLTNPALKGFIAGFHDGTYGYAVPYYNGAHFGKVAFWALASFGQVQLLDLTLMDPALKGFNGGFSDGTYSYAVPHHNGAWFGMVARWALASFEQAKALDLTLTDPARKGLPRRLQRWHLRIRYATFNNGAYFDKVTRWSLASFGSVQVLDLAATDPVLTGFGGGFSDGTYHMGTDATSPVQLTSRCYPGVLGYTWLVSQFMALMRLAAFNALRAFTCPVCACMRSMGMCPELNC